MLNAAQCEAAASNVLAGAPDFDIQVGAYRVRFARTADDLRRALELRYRVFNLELGEGLEGSHLTGRDEDAFDASCHHMIAEVRRTREVVGTYRLQTQQTAQAHKGFYSDGEFDLSGFGPDLLAEATEIGRACIDADHRSQKVLFGMWRGLMAYTQHTDSRYLFGCCSLTSQDPMDGRAANEWLRQHGYRRDGIDVQPRADFACPGDEPTRKQVKAVKIPKLFNAYLRFGAYVCSGPAIDREFGTIDFLVVMDMTTLSKRTISMLTT